MPPAGSQPRRCRPSAAVSSPRSRRSSRRRRARPERARAHAGDQHHRQIRDRRNGGARPRRQLVDAGRRRHVLDAAQAERRRQHAGGDHHLRRHGTGSASPSDTPSPAAAAPSRAAAASRRAPCRAPTVVCASATTSSRAPARRWCWWSRPRGGRRCPDPVPSAHGQKSYFKANCICRGALAVLGPAAGGGVDGAVRRVEARRVGQVERLGAELQPVRADPELLEQREVERLVAVLAQDAAAESP